MLAPCGGTLFSAAACARDAHALFAALCWLCCAWAVVRPSACVHVHAQEKKQLVFEGTVGRDVEALGRLTEDDLRFLFG